MNCAVQMGVLQKSVRTWLWIGGTSLNMNSVMQTVSEDMVVDRWDLAWLASPYVLLLTLGSGHTGVPQVLS